MAFHPYPEFLAELDRVCPGRSGPDSSLRPCGLTGGRGAPDGRRAAVSVAGGEQDAAKDDELGLMLDAIGAHDAIGPVAEPSWPQFRSGSQRMISLIRRRRRPRPASPPSISAPSW
jgi:hypothetical protein